MDYRQAERLKKKSILSLIAERKYEQGQTLGSAIKTSVSDKFAAKAKLFKKRFDPLNWISSLTGNGVIGRSIRTSAGRLMGRSDRDIEYFGGYRRKGAQRQDRTRITSGSRSVVKIGDNSVDILAKMYNLMRKVDEENAKKYEKELNFAEERKYEAEMRHKQLLDAIRRGRKRDRFKDFFDEKKGEDKKGGIFSSILKAFKNVFGVIADLGKLIIKSVFGVVEAIVDIAKMGLGIFTEVAGGIATFLFETVLKPFLGGMVSVIESIAKRIFFKLLPETTSLLWRAISSIIQALPANQLTGPIKAAAALASIFGGSEAMDKEQRERLLNSVGPDAFQKMQEKDQLEKDLDLKQFKNAMDFAEIQARNKKFDPASTKLYEEAKARYEERAKPVVEKQKEIDLEKKKYQDDLTEALEEKGFKVTFDNDIATIKDSTGKTYDIKDLDSFAGTALYGLAGLVKRVTEASKEFKFESKSIDEVKSLYEGSKESISSTKKEALEAMDKFKTIPAQEIEKTEDKLKSMGIIQKEIKNPTPPKEEQVGMVNLPPVRDTEETLSRLLYNNTRVV